VQVMIPKLRINWNFFIAPDAGLPVQDLPIFAVEAVVNDVARKANKRRIDVRDGPH